MLTYKRFKKIYKHTKYSTYVWNCVSDKIKKICNIPRAIYLCIKYPFIYPRSRFSDLHYNNWGVVDKMETIKFKYQRFDNEQIEYWTNWWSKPVYKLLKFYHDVVLQTIFGIPTYTEWDCMNSGWKRAFGMQYLKELKEAAIKDKCLKELRILQIKEKWGRNQVYVNIYGDNILEVINKYENLSWDTCIKCGKPATHTSIGWISPYCTECAKTVGGHGCVERGTPKHDKLWI